MTANVIADGLRHIQTLNNIGASLYNQGRVTAALDFFQEALCERIETIKSYRSVTEGGEQMNDDEEFRNVANVGERTGVPRAPIARRLEQMEECLRTLLNPENHIYDSFEQLCQIGMEPATNEALLISTIAVERSSGISPQGTSSIDEDDFKILYNIGLISSYERRHDSAVGFFSTAALLMFRCDDYLRLGPFCFHHIGRMHYFKKRYGDAIIAFAYALRGATLEARRNETGAADYETATNLRRYRLLMCKTLQCLALSNVHESELDKAFSLSEEALSVLRASNPSALDEAIVLNVMGTVQHARGNYVRARDNFLYFLHQIGTMGCRSGHPYVFTTMHRLGEVLTDMTSYDESLQYLFASLHAKRLILGINHAELARVNFGIGRVLEEKHDLAGALEQFKEAFRIQYEVLMGRNAECLRTICHISHILYTTSLDLNAAVLFHERALELTRKLLGITHPLVAFILKKLRDITSESAKSDDELEKRSSTETQEHKASESSTETSLNLPENASLTAAFRLSLDFKERAYKAGNRER